MKLKKTIVLLLTIVTTFSFFGISNLQAKENIISYDLAKKLNVNVSDVEFSNINENQLDRIFSSLSTNYFDTPIGKASESIETTTFTYKTSGHSIITGGIILK